MKTLENYLRQQLNADDPNVLDIQVCANHKRGLDGWINYITKGLSAADHRRFRTPLHFRDPQGEIIGKRAGVSKSIGPTARANYWTLGRHPQETAEAAQRMARAAAEAARRGRAA